jgi:hypothetical protein
MAIADHPFYLLDSKHGKVQGFSTLDQGREALLAWVLLQRQAGEAVSEHHAGQWSDSRVTRWITDAEGAVISLESSQAHAGAA